MTYVFFIFRVIIWILFLFKLSHYIIQCTVWLKSHSNYSKQEKVINLKQESSEFWKHPLHQSFNFRQFSLIQKLESWISACLLLNNISENRQLICYNQTVTHFRFWYFNHNYGLKLAFVSLKHWINEHIYVLWIYINCIYSNLVTLYILMILIQSYLIVQTLFILTITSLIIIAVLMLI